MLFTYPGGLSELWTYGCSTVHLMVNMLLLQQDCQH